MIKRTTVADKHGRDDSGVGKRGLTRRYSSAAILNLSGGSDRSSIDTMNSSRVNALSRASVNRHSEAISRLLLSSKKTLDKRAIIESAFRACRDAFMEVWVVLLNLLDERSTSACILAGDVRRVVTEVLDKYDGQGSSNVRTGDRVTGSPAKQPRSYAYVAGSFGAEVHVSRGPTVELTDTTSFIVVPDYKHADKYASSQATMETLCKVFKPSDCRLRVNKISFASNNGVRIEAFSPDIERIKAHPGIATAGLVMQENLKINPKLIMHGIPADMSADEIMEELIAQNLNNDHGNELKVIYIFPLKQNKRSTSCVLEVSPAIRNVLLGGRRIFLRYAVCTFANYIRIL